MDSATCSSFQINTVAFSTFLNRLAAVVRSRTVEKGDATTSASHTLEPGKIHRTGAGARAAEPSSSAIPQDTIRARRQACPRLLSSAPE